MSGRPAGTCGRPVPWIATFSFARPGAGVAALLLPLLLSGCFSLGLPTQSNPSCSWTVSPPSNSAALCHKTFDMLQAVTNATVREDRRRVDRFVTAPPVAARILSYGRTMKREGLMSLHVDPSVTMGRVAGGRFGVGFYLIGKTRSGNVSQPQQMIVTFHAGAAHIVGDQPGQEW